MFIVKSAILSYDFCPRFYMRNFMTFRRHKPSYFFIREEIFSSTAPILHLIVSFVICVVICLPTKHLKSC